MSKNMCECQNNIILTGIPRSGTTLACYLLHTLPNTVALVEPMDGPQLLRHSTRKSVLYDIDQCFEQSRVSLLTERRAVSREIQGQIPDNLFEDFPRFYTMLPESIRQRIFRNSIRKPKGSKRFVTINKPLTPDFSLCLKHTGLFTVLLEQLQAKYAVYAVIRNPLALLASWNSTEIPPLQGHVPLGEQFDLTLKKRLDQLSDCIERQFVVLDWYFEQYARYLPSENIIKYEDIILSGGAALDVITPQAVDLKKPLHNRNANPQYPQRLMRKLGLKLLNTPGKYWEFYSFDSVQILSENIKRV